jgi:hypothetical protein
MYACVYMCAYIHVRCTVHMYASICKHIYACVCICASNFNTQCLMTCITDICECVCMYVYIYVYICIYIYIYDFHVLVHVYFSGCDHALISVHIIILYMYVYMYMYMYVCIHMRTHAHTAEWQQLYIEVTIMLFSTSEIYTRTFDMTLYVCIHT